MKPTKRSKELAAEFAASKATQKCAGGTKLRPCRAPATVYRNAWYCAAHLPEGDPACSHSLGREWCSYCGAALTSP